MEGKIFKAIIGTMKDIGAIGKDQTNTFDKYKFRGIDDVYNALQPAMVKNGIFVAPSLVSINQEDRISRKSESSMIHTTLQVKYTFFAEDGSFVETVVPGEAADRSDKSINKAMSAAFKYACFQTFCIPTEEMKDADAESPEIGTKAPKQEKPKQKEVKQSAPVQEAPPSIADQSDLEKLITDEQRMTLIKELDRIGETVAWLEDFAMCKLNKLTRLRADNFIRQLKSRPDAEPKEEEFPDMSIADDIDLPWNSPEQISISDL